MYPSPPLRRVREFVRGYSRASSSLNIAKTYPITFRHVRLDSIRFKRPQRTAETILLQRLLNIFDAHLTGYIRLYSKHALNNVYFELAALEIISLQYLKFITVFLILVNKGNIANVIKMCDWRSSSTRS
jgi:hypothetical protein